jgi:hypothetical protein
MPSLMQGVGRHQKAAWAGEAARRVQDARPEQVQDITTFVREIDRFLVAIVQEWATSAP